MAHYDLYNSIGLDRSLDSAALARELDSRINSGVATNPGGIEELRIARSILGDAQRRGLYDQKLADTNAPDINIAALRDLANADFGGQGSTRVQESAQGPSALDKGRETFTQYSKQAQERLNPAMEKTKSEIARSSKGVIAGTAAATALVMLLLFGLVSALGGDRGESTARKTANQFLELRTNDETERWLIDNAAGDARGHILKTLKVGDGFSGVDNYFKASDPKAGDAINFREFARFGSRYDDATYDRAISSLGADEMYLVEVRNGNDSSAGGVVAVAVQDGKGKIAYFERNLEDVSEIFEDYQ